MTARNALHLRNVFSNRTACASLRRIASFAFGSALTALALGFASETAHAQGASAPITNPHASESHEGHEGEGANAPDAIPEDIVEQDPTLPPGMISVRTIDGKGLPLPRTEITLAVIESSIAKGESRKKLAKTTDDVGRAQFDGLARGSGMSYRVSVMRDGASFALPPVQLNETSGIRAEIHVYPVTRNIEEATIVTQSATYFEVKDDRVQFEQAFMVYNLGRSAWVPENVVIALPVGHKAVTSQQGPTDVGIDPVEGTGIRLRGTFGPGRHEVQFRWQLPYSGESAVNVEVAMPPHMASSRVVASASQSMTLDVKDFGKTRIDSDGQGQRVLIAEKQLSRDEPLKYLRIALTGVPQTGLPWSATTAACGGSFLLMAGAIAAGFRTKKRVNTSPAESKNLRDRLLAELVALEEGKRSGEIGPKTYQRAYQTIIDELALTLAQT
jgi:hypothetical protein